MTGFSFIGIIVDLLIFCVIVSSAIIYYRRGLTTVVFRLCSGFIAFILVFILYKPITNYIVNNYR